jgi:hypothetical protein
LCIRDRHRSNDKDRGGQSHGDFSHRKPSLRVCVGGVTRKTLRERVVTNVSTIAGPETIGPARHETPLLLS